MPLAPIPPAMPNRRAIAAVAEALGMTGVDIGGGDYTALFEAGRAIGLPRNSGMSFRPTADLPGAAWHVGPAAAPRVLPASTRLGMRRATPGCEFGGGGHHAPSLDMIELTGGTVMRLAGAAIVVAGDGVSVAGDVSSAYAPLLHVYDVDAAARVAAARTVDGAAFVLLNDIGDDDYCHGLIDELPRLALLRDRDDVTIVIDDGPAPWRRELLGLLGVPERCIVALGPDDALRAATLLVPNVTRDMQHPARRGAAWVGDWLRGEVGLPALARVTRTDRAPTDRVATDLATRFYIGCVDARTRLVNEAALLRVLEPAGFVSVTLAGRPVAEQVALFSRAEAIVALHGAALANLVFCAPGTNVVEILPPTSGTSCFGLLSAAHGLRHATYVTEPGGEAGSGHDCVVDVAAFWREAGPWLRASSA